MLPASSSSLVRHETFSLRREDARLLKPSYPVSLPYSIELFFALHTIFSDIAQDLITLKSDFDIPVCLIGDFNAWTGLLDDFLHIENEISNLTGLMA